MRFQPSIFVSPGQRFGRLVVLDPNRRRGLDRACLVRCDCGREFDAVIWQIHKGSVVSCGCRQKNGTSNGRYKHGAKGTRLYRIWKNMKARCTRQNLPTYHHYGGRGVTVCDEWIRDFTSFQVWALSHGYDDSLSLDRIDNDGPYSPNNCRFSTRLEQANNKRTNRMLTAFGETKSLTAWSRDTRCVVRTCTLYDRICSGWPVERALAQPQKQPSTATRP